MSDPRASQPVSGQPAFGGENAPRADMGEALRQAMSALNAQGGGPVNGSGLTAEMLTDLARRAGYNSPERIADLGRMMGLDTRTPGSETAKVPQHIFFVLAGIECALPADAVQGVERITEITAVPNTHPWVLGVVQVWGAILSVVDLRILLGLAPQPITGRNRLLVVTQREMSIGFVAEAVTEMRPLGTAVSEQGIARAPTWAQPYLSGTATVDGRLILVLDPERLLWNEQIHRYRADL